jgi:hypothetical protein
MDVISMVEATFLKSYFIKKTSLKYPNLITSNDEATGNLYSVTLAQINSTTILPISHYLFFSAWTVCHLLLSLSSDN